MKENATVAIRNMRAEDIPQILELEKACFPRIPPDRYWIPGMLEAHVNVFPEGQWVAAVGSRIVGSATNLRVNLADALKQHTWRSITGGGYLTTHRPDGNALYGTEIMVHPDARRRGIARKLYEARKQYIVRNGLHAFVSGGRIPGYERYADAMPAEEYVARVLAGLEEDRTLTPQMRSGMRVAGVLHGYITDPPSRNHATILLWLPPAKRERGADLDAAAHE